MFPDGNDIASWEKDCPYELAAHSVSVTLCTLPARFEVASDKIVLVSAHLGDGCSLAANWAAVNVAIGGFTLVLQGALQTRRRRAYLSWLLSLNGTLVAYVSF